MLNRKSQSKSKVFGSLQAIDRRIAKAERDIRKVHPTAPSYVVYSSELYQLRQKRAKLSKSLH